MKKPQPAKCKFCQRSVEAAHWFWMKDDRYLAGGKWRCRERRKRSAKRSREKRNSDPVRREKFLKYQRSYAAKNLHRGRFKSYCSIDRILGRKGTIKWSTAKVLMKQPCFYCTIKDSGGLDRKNSAIGHLKSNVVPCCEKCNFILGDLPFKAKMILKPALEVLSEKNVLEDWIIPTKRTERK